MEKGKILAVDYGAASVGLAVSDVDRQMAFGRGILKKKDNTQVFREISSIVREDNITVVVVGLPLGKDGEETKQTEKIREFAEKMRMYLEEEELNIKIDYIDESFSTFEADLELREIGVKSENRKNTEDEMAAIILVKRYIDFRP